MIKNKKIAGNVEEMQPECMKKRAEEEVIHKSKFQRVTTKEVP